MRLQHAVARRLSAAQLTPGAVWAFCHLLVFGSLVGFVAFNWLLGHVSAAQVGTHAYVNPAIAVLVAWFVDHEPLTLSILGAAGVILLGVALVRARRPAVLKNRTELPSCTGEERGRGPREDFVEVHS